MSLFSTQDAKDRIRQAIDIVDLVGSYIPLRRQGRHFAGLCPWHNDSKPSLQVNQERGWWKCWVCNIGGDIFSFVMRREGVEFREALQMLADRAGISLQASGPKTKPGDANDKRTLYEAIAWAEKEYRDYLRTSPDAEVARRYLAERKLSQASLDQFQLGFSPSGWQWLIERARTTTYSNAVLSAAGLLGQKEESGRYYDFFRGRVMFPIRDAQGRPIAFGARVLPELAQENTGKYINTRETRLFSKSEQVYALDQAKHAIADPAAPIRNVIVVEGYMDVIMCHQHGIRNVVAVLGTALGPKHISLLRRYADRITLLLDGDRAGQKRTNEVLELFVAGEVDLRIATLPDELDPCEFLEERSADDFREMIATAHDALEHALEVHTREIDLVRDTHRANQALETLLGILARSPRLTSDTSTSRLLRERQIIARLAREFRVDEGVLRQRIAELRTNMPGSPENVPRDSARNDSARDDSGRRNFVRRDPGRQEAMRQDLTVQHPAGQEPPAVKCELSPLDGELLEILIRKPELMVQARTELITEHFSVGVARQIWDAYQAVSVRGEIPEFVKVLDELEEPHLKNLLIELDERASSKEVFATEDAASRLTQLIEEIRYQFQAADRRRQLATLELKRLAEAEELQLLQHLVAQERKRQGIPAPTDG